MRRTARNTPRNGPCFSIAPAAYSEHVGTKRHAGGSIGESNALVRRDERDEQAGHRKNRPSSAATAANSASPAPGRAISTTSRCGGRAEGRPVEERLDPPAQPIADDRIADRLRDRDADPGRPARVGGQENEKGPNLPLAATLDPRKVAPPAERLVPAHRASSPRRSDGEAVATLFAARREDLTAVLGAHALEETVDALASAVVRLKGPFHGTGAPNEMGKRKAPYCIGPRPAASRVKSGIANGS